MMKRLYVNGLICASEDEEILKWSDYECLSPRMMRAFLEENKDEKEIELWVNCYGGDVWAAVEIYNLLKDFGGETHALITGLCASAATIVMLGCSVVSATPGAQFMIHNAQGVADGDYHEMYTTADQLTTANDALRAIYVKETGLDAKEIKTMMEKTTWFSAETALNAGLIDGIADLSDAKIAASVVGGERGFNADLAKDYRVGISAMKDAFHHKQAEEEAMALRNRALAMEKERFNG